jgi:hypothetical protein
MNSLLPQDIEMFERLRIPLEMVAEAGIHRGTDREIRARYGITWEPAKDVGGIWYPKYHAETSCVVGGRVRRDHPDLDEDGQPTKNKYICPSGNSPHLYFLLSHKAKLHNRKIPAVLVEAEKSVLALAAWADRTSTEILPLGLGGCYGWHSQRARSWLAPNGEWQKIPGPIDDLKYCNNRVVYVMLDSNCATNPDVRWARTRLVIELNKESRNCTVRVCTLQLWGHANGR